MGALTVLLGCGDSEGVSVEDSHGAGSGWALETLHTVPQEGPLEEPLTYDPRMLIVTDSGLLFVYDPPADHPFVLIDPATGEVLNRFGRRGQGPGELGGDAVLARDEGGDLLALDLGNRQIHRFSMTGEWIDSERVDAEIAGQAMWDRWAGGFLAKTFGPGEDGWGLGLSRLRVGLHGDSSLFRFEDETNRHEGEGIQSGRDLWVVLRGGLVTMWSGDSSFEVRSREGAVIGVHDLPLTNRELGTAEIAQQVSRHGQIAATSLREGPIGVTNQLVPLGDTIFGMLVSSLWRAEEDGTIPLDSRGWRLVSLSGAVLGTVWLDPGQRILGRGQGDSLWFLVTEEDGRQRLQEVELVRTP